MAVFSGVACRTCLASTACPASPACPVLPACPASDVLAAAFAEAFAVADRVFVRAVAIVVAVFAQPAADAERWRFSVQAAGAAAPAAARLFGAPGPAWRADPELAADAFVRAAGCSYCC